MRNRANKKIISLALAAVMMFTLLPCAAVCAEETVTVEFETLSEDVAEQTVPFDTPIDKLFCRKRWTQKWTVY